MTAASYLAACLGWIAVLLAVLWAPGAALARALGECGLLRDATAQIGLGMGVWIALLFALCCLRWAEPPVVSAAALVAALAAVALAWRRVRLPPPWSAPQPAPGWAAGVLGFLLAAAAAAFFVLAAFPTIGWDDAVYHLRLPRLYLEHGGFRWVPLSLFSHWPQNMEMLYLLALALADQALAKLLHLALGALVALGVYRACRRECEPLAALVAAVLWVANPVVLFQAGLAYVDVAVTFFLFLGFRAVGAASDGDQRRHLVLAGVFAGLAAGTKLTAWAGVASLAVLAAVEALRARRGLAAARAALWVTAPALLLALPWHLKAWLETGNPVYPFLYGAFGGAEWSPRLADQFARLAGESAPGRAPLDFLLLPWRLATSAFPGRDLFDGAVHPLWLLALPVAVAGARRSATARRSLLGALFFFLVWSLGPQEMRYLMPVLPLLAVASGCGLQVLVGEGARARLRAGLAAAAAAGVLAGSLWSWLPLCAARARLLQRHGRALDRLVVPPALRFLNEHTPAEARVLFLDTNKAFFCRRECLADSIFQASQIADWLRSAGSEEELQARLRREGVTHILRERVDWGIDYPPALAALLADPRRCRALFESPERRFVVYELVR